MTKTFVRTYVSEYGIEFIFDLKDRYGVLVSRSLMVRQTRRHAETSENIVEVEYGSYFFCPDLTQEERAEYQARLDAEMESFKSKLESVFGVSAKETCRC